jgi:hypothetical protein
MCRCIPPHPLPSFSSSIIFCFLPFRKEMIVTASILFFLLKSTKSHLFYYLFIFVSPSKFWCNYFFQLPSFQPSRNVGWAIPFFPCYETQPPTHDLSLVIPNRLAEEMSDVKDTDKPAASAPLAAPTFTFGGVASFTGSTFQFPSAASSSSAPAASTTTATAAAANDDAEDGADAPDATLDGEHTGAVHNQITKKKKKPRKRPRKKND